MQSPRNNSTNTLLGFISPAKWKEVRAHAEESAMAPGGNAGDPHTHLQFPTSGMLSIVVTFPDGSSQEVGCVGREGMSRIDSLISGKRNEIDVYCQIAGRAISLPIATVQALFATEPEFRAALLDYIGNRVTELSQIAACNAHHNINSRLAKWLLVARDRTRSDTLRLTHDYLALMLGTRRATVTLSAQHLAAEGMIRYKRGEIDISNPEALIGAACDCYRLSPFPKYNFAPPPRIELPSDSAAG